MLSSLLRPFQIIASLIRSNVVSLLLRSRWDHAIPPQEFGQAWARFFVLSGPLFIKLGQLISTRQETFSEAFLLPLTALQEDVQSFDGLLAQQLIEKAFDQPIDNIFSFFQTQAIASASIAQVHLGVLHNGKKVVAKILRPHVRSMIKTDLIWMKRMATFSRWMPSLRGLNALLIVQEFERILAQETNLLMEAGAMAQAKRNHASDPVILIPEVMWPYVSADVLIMEYMPGERLRHLNKLKEQGITFDHLAKSTLRMFMQQVFRDASFHGDLHPGNIFIDTRIPTAPKLVLIDFGIMAQLNLKDRYYLYANFQALLKHQYLRVATLHVEAGWIPTETNLSDFAAYARAVVEPICHKPIHEISVAQLLSRLLTVGKRFNMKLLPELVLLQKSLIHVENIVRQLDPHINVWKELNAATNHSLLLYQEILTHYIQRIPASCLAESVYPVQKKSRSSHWLTLCIGMLLPIVIAWLLR